MASFVRSARPFAKLAARVVSVNSAKPAAFAPLVRAARVAPVTAVRSFSAANARANVSASKKLSDLLSSELSHEEEVEDSNVEEEKKEIQKFLSSSKWKVDAKDGSDEVCLTKSHGDEKVSILFSLSDINNHQEDMDMDEEDQEEDQDEEQEQDFTVTAIVNCEKPNSVISFNVEFGEADVIVNSVAHYASPALATAADSESDWQRRGLYSGPSFPELEEDLQNAFYEYLAERGVNSELAEFIPRFVEHREQNEYVSWLNKVKSHVSA